MILESMFFRPIYKPHYFFVFSMILSPFEFRIETQIQVSICRDQITIEKVR